MSFSFNWPRFSDQFHHDAIQMLNNALNKGNKPPIIADKIEVVELEMGTQPPELEIRDIGDLAEDHFRGIFRLTYSGDAHLVLKTKVQANPLNHQQPDIHLMTGSRGMLAARQPLVVPMLLRLSHFRLSSYVVLVVSKQKGITLVFKTDPLQNVDINSTFDSIAVIQKFIQREIEGQLRQMFREDLPGIIHRLSQQWVKAKVEAPYLTKRHPLPMRQHADALSMPDLSHHQIASGLGLRAQSQGTESVGTPAVYRRPRSSSGISSRSLNRTLITGKANSANPSSQSQSSNSIPTTLQSEHVSFPDLENFDPTYGLRPEGLPIKSGFRNFRSLFSPNKGLADLAEEPTDTDEYDDELASFDMVDWDDALLDISPPTSVNDDQQSVTEYETIPAVGGGTITRPRIIHAQAMVQPPGSTPTTPSLAQSSRNPLALGSGHATNSLVNPYFADIRVPYSAPPFPDSTGTTLSQPGEGQGDLSETHHSKSQSFSSIISQGSTSSPPSMPRRANRRLSVSSTTTTASHVGYTFASGTSPPNEFNPATLSTSPGKNNGDPKIVLRPSLMNNSIRQLSTLSHSNHTLSPYTRSLAHFTVRSVPPRGLTASLSMERQPVKARRKRTFRLGAKQQAQRHDTAVADGDTEAEGDSVPVHPPSPAPPSEFDASDMDLYFRPREDVVPSSRQSSISQSQSTRQLRKRPPQNIRS
ncbi:hypothetical protein AX17_002091 [Amanita inopinata Kibby_2008]|nr:hypothetical protein AX17_002091 [Amanita inopinata Kibby_2008]